jgi:AraC family transcriptional regulator of adaptative response / DNA-3-methyladenine glycosylase II
MTLDRDMCYRAIRTRDARFDGRLFTGVRTTGIYCRPICPARTPHAENVVFFATAAAAQEAGFPPLSPLSAESSPDLAAWRGTSNTVSRALALIADGGLDGDDANVEAVAMRLGIGERQLRRLFQQHLGASPIAVAQTRRILFAKQLIHETRMSMAEVAMAAGFGSVRRFNETFRRLYGRPPSALRRQSSDDGARRVPTAAITLLLSYAPPYDWAAMIDFLAARAIAGVEVVEPQCYRRTIALDGQQGTIEVRPARDRDALAATIRFPLVRALPVIVARIRRVFDLAADIEAITAQLAEDPLLARLIAARPGLRVPGAWDGFELAVRAVLGQQITVTAARRLAGKLVASYGDPVPSLAGTDGLNLVFPSADRLATANLASLGMPRARAATLAALGRARRRRPAALRPRVRSRGRGGALAGASRHRRMDRAIRRDASAPGAGRVPGRGRRIAAGDEPGRRNTADGDGVGEPRGSLAALAGLCRAAPLGGERGTRDRRCARRRGGGGVIPAALRLHIDPVPSPLGTILVVWDDDGTLRALDFTDYESRMQRLLRRHYGDVALEPGRVPAVIGEPLTAFFAGDLEAVASVAVRTNGTAFQRRVWSLLREVPAGTTTTYGALAATLGQAGASRAVGLANGANPIAIIVPCHRVVGADGSLTGYGGGLERKRWLLDHERASSTGRRRISA